MMQNARSLFGLWILVGACSSPEGDTELRALPFDLEESGAVILSEEEGLEEYISLVSEAKGWSRAEALLHSQEAEAMARIVDRLLSIDPDRYVGGAISPKPGGIARLYIKGPLDELIRDLVGSESMAVEVVPNQPFSSREIEARGEELLIALRDAGLRDASLGTDITRPGHFDLTLRRQSSFTEAQSVLEAIPEKFRDDVSVTLQDEPVVRLQAAGGGLSTTAGDFVTRNGRGHAPCIVRHHEVGGRAGSEEASARDSEQWQRERRRRNLRSAAQAATVTGSVGRPRPPEGGKARARSATTKA